ncbi:hypothetical protein WJX82_008290 [Trebouxia sp. C0006]
MNEQRQKVSFDTSHQTALPAGLQLLWRYLAAVYAHAACFGSRLKSDCQQHWAGVLNSTADLGQAAPEPGYGYKGKLNHLLKTEFPHLKSKVYADHAGAGLYSKSQIDAFQQDLASHLFGNPHSQHGWSGNEGSAQAVAEARQLTLQMCNAPLGEYECVFTSGATGALKLVAEAFPWQEGSQFVYTQDNHNSVLGIRELAIDQGASATCVEMSSAKGSRTEFAAVGQSMDSGRSEGDRWHVLIDAAKACATAPPDLTQNPADFVALSYYKIFGYPTGLGALLVHKRAVPALMKRKRYFGGGTVAVSLAEEDFFRRREGAAGLEDGTAHYLGIAAVRHGFHQLAALGGFPAIGNHSQSVTRWFAQRLVALRHADGAPLCVLYGAHHLQPGAQAPGAVGQGPVVTFNMLRHDGSFFGYREVEKLAGLHGIFLRTGCFCNPGACARHLGISASQSKRNFEAGHVCWDDNDIIDGRPTGAVRVSFGWMSSLQDAEAILTFVQTCFLNTAGYNPSPGVSTLPSLITSDSSQEASEKPGSRPDSISDPHLDSHASQGSLEGIWVYPIKSCGGIRVSEWPLGPNGLLLDREWALVGDDGSVLTQKGLPKLVLIQPKIDLAQGLMQVSMPGMQHELVIPLPLRGSETKTLTQADLVVGVQVRICADNVCSLQEVAPGDRQEEVKTWFQQALGIRCCLVRQQPGSRKPISPSQTPWPGKGCDQDPGGHIGFANEGQFLLMNSASLADMNNRIAAQVNKKQTAGCKGVTVGGVGELSRFRPNLLVGGPSIQAYAEDAWQELQIGTQRFFTAGPCARCEMICMDQTTAVRAGPEPLLTLATYRRQKGRILLGILLGQRLPVLSQ